MTPPDSHSQGHFPPNSGVPGSPPGPVSYPPQGQYGQPAYPQPQSGQPIQPQVVSQQPQKLNPGMKPIPVRKSPAPVQPQPGQPQPGPGAAGVGAVNMGAAGMARPVPLARPVPIKKKDKNPNELRVSERGDDALDLESPQDALVKNTPPFLVSIAVHVAIVLVLALMVIELPSMSDNTLEMSMQEEIYSEELGDQIHEITTLITNDPDPNQTQVEFSPSDLPPVPDPFASPSPADLMPDGATASAFSDAPVNGIAHGRTAGAKKGLLARFGGTKTTEESVRLALKWLAAQQRNDGSWSLQGPYKDPASYENPVAATAMALLAFQGYGITDTKGEWKTNVDKGWKAMLKYQNPEGLFTSPAMGNQNNLFYTQGQALIAVCEMYAMTQDPKYKEPAQRAIDYCVKNQDQKMGGWRYTPGNDSDTSVTGWIFIGLMSGKMAGLDVPEATLQKVGKYLDAAQRPGGSEYSYLPGGNQVTTAMTAEGLLMRQYMGWPRDDERLLTGVKKVVSMPVTRKASNVYYWYYATQLCHHMEGEYWNQWNSHMRQIIPESQLKNGPEAGSYDPAGDDWGPIGGRLFMTCMCTYMLEVYYRHMPLYDKLYQPSNAGMNTAGP